MQIYMIRVPEESKGNNSSHTEIATFELGRHKIKQLQ